MKKFFLLLLICQIGFAQTSTKVLTGIVTNKQTKESIPFVTITVKNPKQTKSAIADENGKFLIENLTMARYFLVIEAIGYKTYRQPIAFKGENFIDLNTVFLEENAQELEAVVLRAETSSIKQKIDRIVINVGKDLTSTGTDAASVLNNVQSVSVDQQTGELSLRGNSNVKVLIDGKPTNIPTDQLLQQLPSNAIKNIEIITNPSAKYNPEGNSGIINIELVKNSFTGFNGSVNASATYGRNLRGNGGFNLNYKKNNVNWYATYSVRAGDSDIIGKLERSNNVQETYGVNFRRNHLLKLGTDIDLNKKTSVSVFTIQTLNFLNYTNTTDIYSLPNRTATNKSVFEILRDPRSQTYDVSLHHMFDEKKHTLDFGVSYNTRKSPEDSTTDDLLQPDDQANNFIEEIDDTSKRVLINLDYAKPINDDISIEAGLEYRSFDKEKDNFSNQLVKNNNGDDEIRNNSDFEFNRKIYSAYFNYRHQIDQLGIQAGVRVEHYDLTGNFTADIDMQNENIEDNVTSIYPSVFATYKLTEKDQLQASYSRRVDRPSPRQLTPIRTWGTPLLTSRGNPNLQQQFTHSFELRYNRKTDIGDVSLTGFYRRINDFISRSLSEDTLLTERIILSFDNFDATDNLGLELAAYLKLMDWWRVNASADLYYQKQQGAVNQKLTEVDNLLFNFRANNNFKINDKLNFQVTTLYRGLDENVQRIRKEMFLTNFGASYKVLNNKGTINFGFSDVFNSFRARFQIENPIPQKGTFNWESQNIRLGFVYNFGQKFKTRKKKRPSEDREAGGDVF